MLDINVVQHPNGDWEGLYINGELVSEGHSGMEEDCMRMLAEKGLIKFSRFEAEMEKDDEGYYPSSMPKELPERS